MRGRPTGGPSLFWLPLILLWALVKAVALPAVVVGLSWWLLPDRWAQLVTGVATLYLAGVAVYAGAALRGQLRSMNRGTFTIRRRHDR
jgi:hypothetical protein